jgi:hypothetical protein
MNNIGKTNMQGMASVNLYGKSRAQLFAEKSSNSSDGKHWWDVHNSQPLESEADKMPEKITLVLTSKEPFGPPERKRGF